MKDFEKHFLLDSDDTGRMIVRSKRTGVKYFIEPIGNSARYNDWGSIDPFTKELVNKKGHQKYRGSIDESDSLITSENGFTNIETLSPGISPFAEIEIRDSKYPSIEGCL